MIDRHMAERMASFRKLIAERDEKIETLTTVHNARLAELSDLTGGIVNKVGELDGAVRALLADIANHESEATACNQGYVNAADKLKAQYDESCAELAAIRDTELARLVAAVNMTREAVVAADAELEKTRGVLAVEQDKLAEAEAEYAEQCRKLRGGKYNEAKKLLAEMEVRATKLEAKAAEPEPEPEPTAKVQTGSPMMCQSCQKIAKPWVLSSSGAALCLDCAQGR